MGMDVVVLGVRELSMRFDKMMDVKRACDKVEIDYPNELKEYFGDLIHEDGEHLIREMEQVEIEYDEGSADMENIYDVDLSDLPDDVYKIRFIIGY